MWLMNLDFAASTSTAVVVPKYRGFIVNVNKLGLR